MAKSFYLTIANPEKVLFDGQVSYLSVHASKGYIGILADHAPLITSLVPGKVEIRPIESKSFSFMMKSVGLLEVTKNQVAILLDIIDQDLYTESVS